MSVRRSSDPVFLQYIWNAIESTGNPSESSGFQSILSSIQSACDPKCTPTKLHHELTNAINDGCLKNINDQYALVPGFEHVQKDRSDWYCYECHTAGLVVSCPTCFRVYHSECISAASESHWSCRLPVEDPTVGCRADPETEAPPKYPCPVCKRLQRVSKSGENATVVGDLQKIFHTAYDSVRNRVNWKTLQKVGYLYEPLRNEYLVYRQINTRIIGDRLRSDPLSSDGYPNRTSFLVDLDNLVHNAAVFYGNKHAISNMARQIRSQLRRAMRESTYCIDCYTRPPTLSPVSRLTAACRKPHRLLWFQHNGWSFRPCKMLYENAEGYEVVCFGGRHEREFVPRARAFEMTFTAPDLGLRMTPSLKKALEEAEEYKANQSAYDRNLPIPTSMQLQSTKVTSRHSKIPKRSSSTGSVKNTSNNRKRKACSKYTTAFGSTDTESVNSAFSKNVKRRKSSDSVHAESTRQTVTRDGAFSASVRERSVESSLSSLTSDSDYSEEDNDYHPRLQTKTSLRDRANSGHSPRHSSNSAFGVLATVAQNHSDRSASPSSSLSSGRPSSWTSSSTTTKPIIRIKPIPPLPENGRSSSNNLPSTAPVIRSRVKPEAATPSSSSALSGPSSGCATIPATASHESSPRDSSFSSISSSSRVNSLVKKPSLATIKPSADDASYSKVKRVRPSSNSGSAPHAVPDANGIRLPPSDRNLGSHQSRSTSDDSDSSSSSSSLSDSTSSVLSSSTVSSDSTIPSNPARRHPLSAKLSNAFPPEDEREKGRNVVSFKGFPKTQSKFNSTDKIFTDKDRENGSLQPVGNVFKSALRSKQPESTKPVCRDPEGRGKPVKNKSSSSTIPIVSESNQPKDMKTSEITKVFPVSSSASHVTGAQIPLNAGSSSVSVGPTPPFSSSSSSSWHSSVSPAALSTTSGLGSSLSDPKSVDASPGEAATLLGNTSFGSQASVQTITTTSDNILYKSAEEHIHRFYTERLALLTAERDQAREEIARRDALIEKLRTEHEAELKRVKQLTWCQICLSQAFYHCCPGTAYCSAACQLRHWTEQHNRECRRRGEAQQQSSQQP